MSMTAGCQSKSSCMHASMWSGAAAGHGSASVAGPQVCKTGGYGVKSEVCAQVHCNAPPEWHRLVLASSSPALLGMAAAVMQSPM